MGWDIEPARQRRSMRRAVTTDCQVVADTGFRLLGRWTLDVSTEGIRVASLGHTARGEVVYVSLRLPRTSLWIDAIGEVVRVARGRRTGEPGPALGIRFTSIEPVDRALLAASLRGLPPPLPARRVRVDYAAAVLAAAA
ncbi:MAG: PilZ domain-containing protein [Myxococcota bacterium]|nr:PilZ domain-containing protein [Myxococcota bacterium]MDW8362719.1 PilZ domain-containing protein [Myxococcales bacterium]